jgi:type II secretory pathway component GspD/PulD (secretin)
MIRLIQPRAARGGRLSGAWVLCCVLLASSGAAVSTECPAQDSAPGQTAAQSQPAQAQPQQAAPDAAAPVAAGAGTPVLSLLPSAGKRQQREAEAAYLAGAKKLEHGDLDAAEREFVRALNLDPQNSSYAIAISVTREHRLTDLVQQATKARQDGDQARAETLLAQARAIDPKDPLVLEHVEPVTGGNNMRAMQSAAPEPGDKRAGAAASSPADRAVMIANAEAAATPWRIEAPVLAGPIELEPSNEVKSFALRGASSDVLREVASAYGIAAIIDDSVLNRNVRFDLENVTYAQAMRVLLSMTHAFAVPVDSTTLLIADDDPAKVHRQQMERQLQETIEMPGAPNDRLNELANIVRTVFGVKQATVQTGLGTIVVRAPEDVLTPLNQVLAGLMDASSEITFEVKLYEVDNTRSTNIGAALPTQFSAFNVDAEAENIVSSNQSLVQQAIAQGLIPANASNLTIALDLIASGLVQSSLASSLIGTIGGGALRTGISGSTNTTFNLALNSSEVRTIDDIQMRVGDRQEATFREGTKYPIVSSSYSSGGVSPGVASALKGVNIPGVNIPGLLSQFAGGSGATIPQVTYEDLGITLTATPAILRAGRINLKLNMKIEALAGGTVNGNPILANRQFTSDITLEEGESAMLVSSVSKTETAALTGMPGLSELPGFQAPTQGTTEKDTSQLVVVVTPHVVRRASNQLFGPRVPVPNDFAN